ncbi:hypothetical protein BKN43_04405 [Klebsiella quasipneumoniae]|nr:hypothetical protein BKN43_04405 [Klebsiella quasipneumoniae]
MKPGRRAGQGVHNASQISFCRVETQRHIDFLNLPPNASHFAGVMPVFYFLKIFLFINRLLSPTGQMVSHCCTGFHLCVANRNTK